MGDSVRSVTRLGKRKTPASAPESRKKQRFQDEIQGTSSTGRMKRAQQTLTQAQWVMPVEQFRDDEIDMEPLKAKDPVSKRLFKPRGSLKKRNSTLTQMDFFGSIGQEEQVFEAEMLQADIPAVDRDQPLPQMDGTWDSPRKPKWKSRARRSSTKISDSRDEKPVEDEEMEFSANKRRKPNEKYSEKQSGRRYSSRIASKSHVFADPAENLEYFQDTLSSIKKTHDPPASTKRAPVLDIKESTGLDSMENRGQKTRHNPTPSVLCTPQKHRTVIPSSQSPESLPTTITREGWRRFESPVVRPSRIPLQPLSTNTILPTKLTSHAKSTSRRSNRRSPKRKVIDLKMPRTRNSFRKQRVEDSQVDVFDIPQTSSPEGILLPFPNEPIQSRKLLDEKRDEIPATSQEASPQEIISPPDNQETQDTLPSLKDLLGNGPSTDVEETDMLEDLEPLRHVEGEVLAESVVVRDFAEDPTSKFATAAQPVAKDSHHSVPLAADTLNRATDIDEDVLDLGSPIMNDTQYNHALAERNSSPHPLADLTHEQFSTQLKHVKMNDLTSLDQDSLRDESESSLIRQTSKSSSMSDKIPLPMLVPTIARRTPRRAQVTPTQSSLTLPLPELPSLYTNSSHISSVKVPLNDTQAFSSSPNPHSMKTATQKSVRPASLPHPSQISTQEVTQPFFLMSSIPLTADSDDDRITIKDSSSVHVSLSQLPQYEGSQSQLNVDRGIDEINDSEDDDDDDLDLNPRGRKPENLNRSTSNLIDLCPIPSPKVQRTTNVETESTLEESPAKRGSRDVEDSQILSSQPQPRDDFGEARGDGEVDGNGDDHKNERDSQSRRPEHWEYIAGFDNDTQSNFTQTGHVTAAFIHRQRDIGAIPRTYIPRPYQVKRF